MAAGELRVGEMFRTKSGEELTLASVAVKASEHRVYNLEVEQEHHFYVGEAGVLVHNAYNLSEEAAQRLFPNSTLVEYGEGLSAQARNLRAAGGALAGVNLAVIELENGTTQMLPSVPEEFHSEESLLKWLNDNNIDRNTVTRLYSEFHPCTQCDPLVRAAFPNAEIQFSWPYQSTSLADEISNAGRVMKRAALGAL